MGRRQIFTPDPAFVKPVVDMMMISREAVVNYMTPLGLHHQIASGHHRQLQALSLYCSFTDNPLN
jgi:alpha-glucuronidase